MKYSFKRYVLLQTAEQAKVLPETASILMACVGQKTLKPIAKKDIMAQFRPKVKHDCPGYGGNVFPMVGQTTGTPPNVYTQHRCTKCGDASAFLRTYARHPEKCAVFPPWCVERLRIL